MIEEIEIGRRPQSGLIASHALGGPAVERVAGGGEHALVDGVRRIEPQEAIGERAVGGANLVFVAARSHRRGGQQPPQRADFTAVEAYKQRHFGLFPAIENVDDLPRQDFAVDGAPGEVSGEQRLVDELARRHRAQRRETLPPELAVEFEPDRFGGRMPMARLLQLRGGDHVGTLRHSLVEQPARGRRGHQIHHAQATGGLAGDGDIVRVPAEGRDIALDPAQRFDLIEEAVISGNTLGRLRAQFRMREKAERADPIIDRYDHQALLGHPGAVIDGRCAAAPDQRATVNPHEHGGSFRALRGPDVKREAVLAHGRKLFVVDRIGRGPGLGLKAGGPELRRVAHADPGWGSPRGLPAQRAHRGGRIGDALEHHDRALESALHLPDRRPHHRARPFPGAG